MVYKQFLVGLFFCFLQRQLSAVQSSDKGLLWGMIRPHCFRETHHPEILVVFLNITMNLLTIHIGSNHECAAAYIYYNTTTIYAGKKDYASYKHLKIRVLQIIKADVKKA